MDTIRVLIIAREDPGLREAREHLEAAGFEAYTAGTSAAGLLLLGRLQPDAIILDPHVGRGRPEDWRRALERYRAGRPLAVALTTEDPGARRLLGDSADLGTHPRSLPPARLQRLLEELDSGESGGWQKAS